MHLWQLDIVGGLPLADGRECKLLTGIDDHSRFVVLCHRAGHPSAREVAEAFTAAMRRYGVPSEVLSDNGGQLGGGGGGLGFLFPRLAGNGTPPSRPVGILH